MSGLSEELSKQSGAIMLEFYKDLLQPGIKQIGQALGATLEYSMSFTNNIQLRNERNKLARERNMENIRKTFANIPEANVIEIAPEIGIPILEKLSYTTNEEIAALFINLLSKSANSSNVDQAHPAFVSMIERLSVDEAMIIKYLYNKRKILYMNFEWIDESDDNNITNDPDYLTDLGSLINFNFPNNISIYLNNLCGLNILVDKKTNKPDPSNGMHSDEYRNVFFQNTHHFLRNKHSKFMSGRPHKSRLIRSYFEVTQMGELFVKACNSSPLE